MSILNKVFILSLLFQIGTPCVWAYRGESVTQEPPLESPGGSLPGYMDAFTAPAGKTVLELPTMSLDYGVTDRLTVGTNLLSPSLSLLGLPLLSLKARYLFFSNENVASSLTVYGGGLWLDQQYNEQKSDFSSLYYLSFTSNTSYYLSSRSILTFHVSVLKVGVNARSDLDPDGGSGSFFGVLPGMSFQHYLNDFFGFEAQILVPAVIQAAVEDINHSTSLDLLRSTGYPHRFMLNIKTGRDAVLSVGVGGFYGLVDHEEHLIPLGFFTFAL